MNPKSNKEINNSYEHRFNYYIRNMIHKNAPEHSSKYLGYYFKIGPILDEYYQARRFAEKSKTWWFRLKMWLLG